MDSVQGRLDSSRCPESGAVESLRGQKRQHGIGRPVQNGEGVQVTSELLCVDETAVSLVEGVSGQATIRIELSRLDLARAAVTTLRAQVESAEGSATLDRISDLDETDGPRIYTGPAATIGESLRGAA